MRRWADGSWRNIDLTLLLAADRERASAELLSRTARSGLTWRHLRLRRFGDPACGEQHRVVLTSHHLLTDGWSVPILVQELLTLYAHHADAAALPRVTPYRDYLGWLAAQDRAAAVAAWQDALAGLEEATPSGAARPGPAALAPEQTLLALSETADGGADPAGSSSRRDPEHGDAGGLGHSAGTFARPRRRGVRRHGVGPAAGDRRHRAHGGAVHQHPAAPHQAAAGQAAAELLKELQDSQSRLMTHQHLGLAEIQSAAGLGELFDTLVVFENYPLDGSRRRRG